MCRLQAVALIALVASHLLVCAFSQPRNWSALGLIEEVLQDDDRRLWAAPPAAGVVAGEELVRHVAVDRPTSLRVLTAPGATPTAFATPPDVATPHITLRTNDGGLFGGSIAAISSILLLGWADRFLASPDAELGGMFYLNYADMWSLCLSLSRVLALYIYIYTHTRVYNLLPTH